MFFGGPNTLFLKLVDVVCYHLMEMSVSCIWTSRNMQCHMKLPLCIVSYFKWRVWHNAIKTSQCEGRTEEMKRLISHNLVVILLFLTVNFPSCIITMDVCRKNGQTFLIALNFWREVFKISSRWRTVIFVMSKHKLSLGYMLYYYKSPSHRTLLHSCQ